MKAIIITLLFITAAVISSCGKSAEPEAQIPQSTSFEGQTLRVSAPFGEGDGRNYDYLSLISEFEQKTGAQVQNELPATSSESWKIEVVDSFENGTEPDVMFFFIGATVNTILDKVISINEIKKEFPNYAVNISVGVLNSMKAQDGENYCVPATGFWESMYINKDLFENNNIKIPETFEEFEIAVEKFREIGITPVAVNLVDTPHYWFEYLIYNFTGPNFHIYPANESNNYDRWVNGLNMFKRLYDLGAFPEDIVSDEKCFAMFENKEAAMMVDGSWSPALQLSSDVTVVNFPAVSMENGGNRQITDIIGGFSMGYYITEKGWNEKKDLAVSFVKFMTDENALELFNKSGSASPSSTAASVAESEIMQSVTEMVKSSTAFTPAVQDSFTKEAREYLFSQIINISRGDADAKEVLDNFIEINNRG